MKSNEYRKNVREAVKVHENMREAAKVRDTNVADKVANEQPSVPADPHEVNVEVPHQPPLRTVVVNQDGVPVVTPVESVQP